MRCNNYLHFSAEDKKHVCKHCGQEFTHSRGFKVHVQSAHIQKFPYKCKYCAKTTGIKFHMQQHIVSKHPGLSVDIIHDPSMELSDEYWEINYGIPRPPGKKRKATDTDDFVCNYCNFRALSLAGLTSHMKIHKQSGQQLSCHYCKEVCESKEDLERHFDINHKGLSVKIEESSSPEKKRLLQLEDPSDEEENLEIEEISVYQCAFCSTRSTWKSMIMAHWERAHKTANSSDDKLETSSKIIVLTGLVGDNFYKCGLCEERDFKPAIDNHCARMHRNFAVKLVEEPLEYTVPEDNRMVCGWCDEVCDNEASAKYHHLQFHSHLQEKVQRLSDSNIIGYLCPQCPFIDTVLDNMRKHAETHIPVFKCKYCIESFVELDGWNRHSSMKHPGREPKVVSNSDYDDLIKCLMRNVKWFGGLTCQLPPPPVATRNSVARKSTTKNCPSPGKAKKSMKPSGGYPGGARLNLNKMFSDRFGDNEREFSFYGKPVEPVDLEKVYTYYTLGTERMRITCKYLSEIAGIDPKLKIKDCLR